MVSWSPVSCICLIVAWIRCFAWTRQDAVVGIEDIDHVFLVEETFIDDGLFESDFSSLAHRCLFQTRPACFCPYVLFLILKTYSPYFAPSTSNPFGVFMYRFCQMEPE